MKKFLTTAIIALLLASCSKTEKCDSSSANRVGAKCKDGTTSNSVGSGTCSGHGGVAEWICQ